MLGLDRRETGEHTDGVLAGLGQNAWTVILIDAASEGLLLSVGPVRGLNGSMFVHLVKSRRSGEVGTSVCEHRRIRREVVGSSSCGEGQWAPGLGTGDPGGMEC